MSETRLIARRTVSRTRLLAEFDRRRRSRVIWVCGPPGSGKTCGVAAYIAERDMKAVRRTFAGSGKEERGCTGWAAEVRNLVREGSVLVIDGVNDPRRALLLEPALRAHLHSGRRDTRVLVSGTAPLPPELDADVKAGRVSVLSWSELRLTFEETAELLPSGAKGAAELVHAQSGGLAAVVVAIVAHARSAPGGALTDAACRDIAWQSYEELLARHCPAGLRDFLLHTAFAPVLTPETAAAASGYRNSARLLEDLAINLRIEIEVAPFRQYDFHPPFREFLRAKAKETFTKRKLEALARLGNGAVCDLTDDRGQRKTFASGLALLPAQHRASKPDIAQREDSEPTRFMVALHATVRWLTLGNPGEAERSASGLASARCGFERALSAAARSWLALVQGRHDTATEVALEAARLAQHEGLALLARLCDMIRVAALIALSSHAEARRLLESSHTRPAQRPGTLLLLQTGFLRAALALAGGDPAAPADLRRALSLGRRCGFMTPFAWTRAIAGDLLATALKKGIERGYVLSLIKTNHLRTNDLLLEEWPWPVRLHTLGALEVVRDGAAVQFTGKTQRKPLDLLGYLASREGRNVPVGDIVEHLWPDAEGDAGQRSFDSTMFRLRLLLQYRDAILLSEHRVSLNPDLVWTDLWAFEQLVPYRTGQAGARPPQAKPAQRAEQMLRLYRGGFLEREEGRPWMVSMREKMRDRFLQAILDLGAELEQSGDLDGALALYRRGTWVDALSERLHLRMMEHLHKRGFVTEAAAVYQRHRELVSILLGMPPSPKMQAAFRALRMPDDPAVRMRTPAVFHGGAVRTASAAYPSWPRLPADSEPPRER